LAELVRGDFCLAAGRPPHRPFVPEARLRHDGHLLPKGRRAIATPTVKIERR
jgi:hypothetical protein